MTKAAATKLAPAKTAAVHVSGAALPPAAHAPAEHGNLPADAALTLIQQMGPSRFFNRELSWLQFNARVLEEASNLSHPLLERVRFLSISATNLDEFYMVRAAGLVGQVREGITTPSADGLTPAQQLAEIARYVVSLVEKKQAVWMTLRREMDANGIHIVEAEDLTEADRAWLEPFFLSQIFQC